MCKECFYFCCTAKCNGCLWLSLHLCSWPKVEGLRFATQCPAHLRVEGRKGKLGVLGHTSSPRTRATEVGWAPGMDDSLGYLESLRPLWDAQWHLFLKNWN